MVLALLLLAQLICAILACVPTQIITTTAPCCPMLSTTSLPKRPPSSSTWEQCSILRRVSSTCPIDGIVVCDAAFDTNPSQIQIELFDANGNVVRTATATGNPATSVSLSVVCVNGKWYVPASTGSTKDVGPIATVSCSQSGSVGADRGYVVGTAI